MVYWEINIGDATMEKKLCLIKLTNINTDTI